MKTLTKKCGIITAVATLLLLTAMLIGCSNGITTTEKEDYTPPVGMGAIRLNFNKDIARTILPDTADITDFNKFQLQFTPTLNGGSISPIEYTDSNDLSTPINLVPGTYTLQVLAYIEDAGNTFQLAASAEEDGIVISSGGNTNKSITLKAIDPASATSGETGVFAWVITPPSTGTINSATLTLTAIGTGTTQSPINLTTVVVSGKWESSKLLPVGYYYADFAITRNGVLITFRHIAHIYQGMTSTFTYEFSDNFFVLLSGTLTPTIDYEAPDDHAPVLTYDDDGDNNAVTPEVDIVNGATITLSKTGTGGKLTSATLTVKDAADYSTINWYCQSVTPRSNLSAFTVNTASGLFSIEGFFQVIVEGVYTADSLHYYSYVVIEVTP